MKIGVSFHPELDSDTPIYKTFIKMIGTAMKAKEHTNTINSPWVKAIAHGELTYGK